MHALYKIIVFSYYFQKNSEQMWVSIFEMFSKYWHVFQCLDVGLDWWISLLDLH
jgi:hypothetical protein